MVIHGSQQAIQGKYFLKHTPKLTLCKAQKNQAKLGQKTKGLLLQDLIR